MKITKDDRIFTMGSCFAREIRYFLLENNFQLYPEGAASELVYYNTYSMLYEFIEPQDRFSDVYKNSDGSWQDPSRRLVFSNTKEDLFAKTQEITDRMKKYIDDATVYVITLGMTEVFKSKNLVWCAHPQYGLKKGVRSGGISSCRFYNSSANDNFENIQKIIALFPEKKFILTVSPIPLQRSFEPSVKTAREGTALSKSRLKEAALKIANNHPNVDYFDSYDFCMGLNEKENIFLPDGRHVKKEVVKLVVERFLHKYII